MNELEIIMDILMWIAVIVTLMWFLMLIKYNEETARRKEAEESITKFFEPSGTGRQIGLKGNELKECDFGYAGWIPKEKRDK